MKAFKYLALSSLNFAAIVALHVISYTRPLPQSAFYFGFGSTALLSVPLVLLFLRVKNAGSREESWHRFWAASIQFCPRWIWGTMTIAWCLALLSIVRAFLGQQHTGGSFHTAWLIMPAGAVLSHAVTLVRTPKHEGA